MKYNIISTGSKGNAVVINDCILIDCGVPYKSIEPYIQSLKLVLLTHIHGDHFRASTIRKLAKMRPTLRFGCGEWLIESLLSCCISPDRIDIYSLDFCNKYSDTLSITAVYLPHNVPNCGYKIFIDEEKLLYATDTNNLNGITAPNYDLYMIEANYEDEEIQERIQAKKENGQYAYEYEVLKNHLSKQKCDDFIAENAGIKSRFIYMHGHIDKEELQNVE